MRAAQIEALESILAEIYGSGTKVEFDRGGSSCRVGMPGGGFGTAHESALSLARATLRSLATGRGSMTTAERERSSNLLRGWLDEVR